MRIQNEYILVVNGAFRDRTYEQTFKEFQNWLCRLAKRIFIGDVLVEVEGHEQSTVIRNRNETYTAMFENPSWCSGGKEINWCEFMMHIYLLPRCQKTTKEINWCEFMMWGKAKNSMYPMMLGYKYFDDEENDAEVERRIKYYG